MGKDGGKGLEGTQQTEGKEITSAKEEIIFPSVHTKDQT